MVIVTQFRGYHKVRHHIFGSVTSYVLDVTYLGCLCFEEVCDINDKKMSLAVALWLVFLLTWLTLLYILRRTANLWQCKAIKGG